MTEIDHAALALAVERCRAEDKACAARIAARLRKEPWWDVATACAYHCQMQALKLRPWQQPPAWVDLDDPYDGRPPDPTGQDGRRQAAELLKEMLAHGVSRWDPDPVAALEAAKAKRGKVAT